MAFPVIGGTQESGYNIDNSLRFNADDNPKLAFTPSSEVVAERKTFTISCWFKRSNLTSFQYLWEMGGNDNANDRFFARFQNTDSLRIMDSATVFRETNRLFRDPSAWYHLVVAVDTTDSTADNRIKIYVNGVQETSFATSNNPGQNDQKGFSDDSAHTIGRTGVDDGFSFDGYMADFNAVGGSQLAPTSFGETNDNGVWIPKNYTGSYGTNGFELEFKQLGTAADATSIGADTSGNNNHFSQTNVTPAVDRTEDTPTNNFCTFNAVDTSSNITLTEGNTVATANSNHSASRATIGLRSGKWYWENKIVSDSGGPAVGIMAANATLGDQLNSTPSRFYRDSGQKYSNGSASSYGDTFTTGDIISVALDMDNGALYFYKNGTIQNSGTAAFTDLLTATTEHWLPAVKLYNEAISINFGNPSHSISSGNSDSAGFGNFEYAPPANYYSLCSKNLAEYG